MHNINDEKKLIDSQLLIGPVILSNAVQLGQQINLNQKEIS
jgi:hypothetical protein